MKTHRVKVPYVGKGTFVNIEPLSDIHVGTIFHDKVKFRECVERIKNDPNRYTILMGDNFDATLPDHKFFDSKTIDPELPELEDQFQYLINLLLPIRHKILGVLTGNHDERLRQKHFNDFVSRLVRELNMEYPEARDVPDLNKGGLRIVSEDGQDLPYKIRYLGYSSFLRLIFMRQFGTENEHNDSAFDMFLHHGFYSGRRLGGNLNNLEDMARDFSADVYLTGHTHQIVMDKKVKMCMDKNGNLGEVTKVFAVCGSFYKGYCPDVISYAEVKGMSPQRCGTITVSFFPFERKIQCHE